MSDRDVPHGFDSIDAVIDAVCQRSDVTVKTTRGDQVIVTPCPLCRKPGDKFAISTESGLWNCPSCGERGNAWQLVERVGLSPVRAARPTGSPAGPARPSRPRVSQAEVESRYRAAVAAFETNAAVRAYVESRGLALETAKAWGLGADGSKVCFPYRRSSGSVAFLKWRDIADKSVMFRWPANEQRTPPLDDPLFSCEALDTSCPVLLTEGEWDALVLGQMGFSNVASVANGAAGWSPDWSLLLAPCRSLYVAYDQDADGEKGALACVRRFGREVVLRMTFGEHKDANDALRAGWTRDDFDRAYGAARRYRPEILLPAADVALALARRALDGSRPKPLLTGHAELDATQRGLRPGELTAVTAHTGAGKTTFVLDLLLRLAERGLPVLFFSMEQGPDATAEQIMGMLCRQHVADMRPEEIVAAAEQVPAHVCLGTEPEADRVERVIEAVRFGVRVYDVQVVALDHLDYLIDPRNGETGSQAASRAVKAIARAAAALAVHVILICQPTTESGRNAHRLTLADMAETRLTRQLAHNGWVISSQKDLNELTVRVEKARHGAARDGISLRYTFDGFRFREVGVRAEARS